MRIRLYQPMKNALYQLGLAALSCAALVVFPNCVPTPGVTIAGKATGGGVLVKQEPVADGKAAFGFNGSSCDGTTTGRFNYNDKSQSAVTAYGKQGVMANGTITAFSQCVTAGGCNDSGQTCPEGGFLIEFQYRSNNPNWKDPGTGLVCVVDGGEGINAPAPDQAGITFTSGAYNGYSAKGPVTGNVQGHLCDDVD